MSPNDNFVALPLFAIVSPENADKVPALFTSESDANAYLTELRENEATTEYEVLEVLALHNFYTDNNDETND